MVLLLCRIIMTEMVTLMMKANDSVNDGNSDVHDNSDDDNFRYSRVFQREIYKNLSKTAHIPSVKS